MWKFVLFRRLKVGQKAVTKICLEPKANTPLTVDTVNRLHERALRIAYEDFRSSFTTILEKDRSVTIHENNLQSLMTEMFKQ